MKKGIVLFDIDLTLFDNNRFIELKDNQIIKHIGIKDIERYKRLLPKYLSTLQNQRDFSPDRFIEIVCKEFNFKNKQSLLKFTYNDGALYSNSLFEDVLSMFDMISSKYRFGVFSEGKFEFQSFKMNSLGLNKYFEKGLIFIFDAKDTSEAISKIPKESIIVDDKETICQFLTNNGFRAIWINRKDDRKSDNFETIYSLLELPAIL